MCKMCKQNAELLGNGNTYRVGLFCNTSTTILCLRLGKLSLKCRALWQLLLQICRPCNLIIILQAYQLFKRLDLFREEYENSGEFRSIKIVGPIQDDFPLHFTFNAYNRNEDLIFFKRKYVLPTMGGRYPHFVSTCIIPLWIQLHGV
jgi:hypothetical protein